MDAHDELAALRRQVDATDDRIVALLAERNGCTRRIGALKAAAGEAPLDATRQAVRRRWLAELSLRHRVDEALVMRLFDVVRGYAVEEHERIARERATCSR